MYPNFSKRPFEWITKGYFYIKSNFIVFRFISRVKGGSGLKFYILSSA